MGYVSGALAAFLVGLAAAGVAPPAEGAELVVSIWGGSYAEEFRKVVAAPFEKQHGVKIVIEGGRSTERLSKLLAARGAGTDVFYITDYQMVVAQERGLLEPIRPASLTHLGDLYGFAKDPLGGNLCPAFTVLGVGIAYNRQHFPTPPSAWTDLGRTDFRGRPGYPDMGLSFGPLMLIRLAELHGGGINNVDPAFAYLKTLKARLQIFKLFEVLDSINQGDVSLAPQLNIFVKKDPKVPLAFTWPKDGGLGVVNLACVVKGTKQRDLAEKLINFHLSPEAQLAMAVSQGESPTNRKVAVPDGLPFNMVLGEDLTRLRFWDAKVVAAKRDAWLKRWQEEIVAQ